MASGPGKCGRPWWDTGEDNQSRGLLKPFVSWIYECFTGVVKEVLTGLLLIKAPIVLSRQAAGAIHDPKCDDWAEADVIKRISYKNYLLSVSQHSQWLGLILISLSPKFICKAWKYETNRHPLESITELPLIYNLHCNEYLFHTWTISDLKSSNWSRV